MDKTITQLKDLFDSIVCLAVEGPEVTTKLNLMKAIEKEAMKGYDLCKELLSQPPKQDKPLPLRYRVKVKEKKQNKPYAIFKAYQFAYLKDRMPLFEVKGGSHNGSTMTLKGLKEARIEIKEREDEATKTRS